MSMKIYLAADHRGYQLKNDLKDWLMAAGYELYDMGAHKYDSHDDYPDFGLAAAQAVAHEPKESFGILLCGSGIGMAVAANKALGVRASLIHNPAEASAGRRDDNINVIALGADKLNFNEAKSIVSAALNTPFLDEKRHIRRIKKISQYETEKTLNNE